MDLNRVCVLGRVAADPEIRYTKSGEAIANVRIATGERWKDKNTGEMKEKSEFIPFSVFGNSAEFIKNYVKKGSRVYAEGKFQTRKWQDSDGNDRYSTDVTISGFSGTFIDLSPRDGSSAPAAGRQANLPIDDDDDIPF